jgi:hypothetical protein
MTSDKFLSDHGIWAWAQPKTKDDGTVVWIANGRYVPTKRHANGLEIDPVHYKECATVAECYQYAFSYLIEKLKQ